MKTTDYFDGLGEAAVPLFPDLVRAFGRNESILMVQIIYWTSGEKKWTYKTSEDIEEITSLTWREQKRARENLVEMGVLKEDRQDHQGGIGFYLSRAACNRILAERSCGKRSCAKRDYQSTQTRDPINKSAIGLTRETEQNKKEEREAVRGGLLGVEFVPTFEERCTQRLNEALREARRIMTEPNYKEWNRYFAKAAQDFGSRNRVWKVLKFYCGNLGQKFMPQAYSGKAFYHKFLNIEDRMPQEAVVIELGPKLQKVYEDVVLFDWPQGSRAELKEVIQKSNENFQAWRARCAALVAEWRASLEAEAKESEWDVDGSVEARLITFYDAINGHLQRAPTSVWIHHVHQVVTHWKDWSGTLSYFTWHPKHAEWRKLLNRWVDGAGDIIDEFMTRTSK